MKFIDSERCRIGAEFSYERRDIFRMADSHWIVWNLFLCNWNIFWIMSSRTRFFGFIPWDKSSSKHTVLWWLFVVNILINDIVSENNIISNRPNNLEDLKFKLKKYLPSSTRSTGQILIKWANTSSRSHTVCIGSWFWWNLWANQLRQRVRICRWICIALSIFCSATHRVFWKMNFP